MRNFDVELRTNVPGWGNGGQNLQEPFYQVPNGRRNYNDHQNQGDTEVLPREDFPTRVALVGEDYRSGVKVKVERHGWIEVKCFPTEFWDMMTNHLGNHPECLSLTQVPGHVAPLVTIEGMWNFQRKSSALGIRWIRAIE